MNIITLTSNYGYRDPYVGILKGLLISENNSIRMVDISHEAAPGNLIEAAYILESSYSFFPEKTVHLCAVEELDSKSMRYLAMEKKGHFFVGPDNGILDLIEPKIKPDKIHEIEIDSDSDTVPGMHIIARAATFLASGGLISVLGQSCTKPKDYHLWKPTFNKELNLLTGHVIFIDRRGSLITNIERKFFEDITHGKKFYIRLPTKEKLDRITPSIGKKPNQSTTFAWFNHNDLLEICVSGGSSLNKSGASDMLGLNFRDTIDIVLS